VELFDEKWVKRRRKISPHSPFKSAIARDFSAPAFFLELFYIYGAEDFVFQKILLLVRIREISNFSMIPTVLTPWFFLFLLLPVETIQNYRC
jgi:hypothetical protein